MKYLIRVFVFNVFSLWFTSQLFPALQIHGGWQILFLAGAILSLLMIFIAPLLKIIFIPINFITFGLFSWIINVIVLYLLTVFIPEVEVISWKFPGFNWNGFTIPSASLTYFVALVISSLMLTCISNILHKLSEN